MFKFLTVEDPLKTLPDRLSSEVKSIDNSICTGNIIKLYIERNQNKIRGSGELGGSDEQEGSGGTGGSGLNYYL